MSTPLKKLAISTILLLFLLFDIFGQANHRCDSTYYRSFYNFAQYDDSVGYSLTYKISLENQGCLKDTVDLINFLLSDRFLIQNQEVLSKMGISEGLGNIHMSFLARRTDHKKIRQQPDSTYKHISDYKVQRIGSGRQLIQNVPIDVLKLYFISALFYNDFQFKNEIVLIKKTKVVETYTDQKSNTDYPVGTSFVVKIRNEKIIKLALKSYNRWKNELNEKGLQKLRQDNISPLSFTRKIEWRNNKYDSFDGKKIN